VSFNITLAKTRAQLTTVNGTSQIHPNQAVFELRQRIIDNPKTCHLTCFYISFNEQRLSDWLEMSTIEGLENGSILDIVLGKPFISKSC
jgi:hypothetical protein